MFKNLLGSYVKLPTVVHNQRVKKSYLFINGSWREVGDIEYFYHPIDENSVMIEMVVPDVAGYAHAHADDGLVDWFEWGPRVN